MSTSDHEEQSSLNQDTSPTNIDPYALERQLQFQKSLEKNLRCYIEYSGKEKELEMLLMVFFTIIVIFIMEFLIILVTIFFLQSLETLVLVYVPTLIIDFFSVLYLLWLQNTTQQRTSSLIKGLHWFQFDSDHMPEVNDWDIYSKLSNSTKLMGFILLCLQNVLLVMIIINISKYQLSIIITFVIDTIFIIRVLFIVIFLTISIKRRLLKKYYICQQNEINQIQEMEYEQYSPINKYQTQIVDIQLKLELKELVCMICLHEFQIDESFIRLQCHQTHVYHRSCLQEWISTNNTCPACRSNV